MTTSYQPRLTHIESQAVMFSKSAMVSEKVKKECQEILVQVAQGTHYEKIEDMYQKMQASVADHFSNLIH